MSFEFWLNGAYSSKVLFLTYGQKSKNKRKNFEKNSGRGSSIESSISFGSERSEKYNKTFELKM